MGDRSEILILYRIIEEYLDGQVSADKFCDEFYFLYDLKIDHNELTEIERSVFDALNSVVSRFSPSESDHKLDANAFATESELTVAVSVARDKLAS